MVLKKDFLVVEEGLIVMNPGTVSTEGPVRIYNTVARNNYRNGISSICVTNSAAALALPKAAAT